MGPFEPIIDTYDWGRMIWLFDHRHDSQTEISLARMEVFGGQTSDMHFHSNSTEHIHLLDGGIQQTIGDKTYTLTSGQTVIVPPNERHLTVNPHKKKAVMMITYSQGQRDYYAC